MSIASGEWRTFTENEQANRDAWITSRAENDCADCETISYPDGFDAWRPAQDCPVHGEYADAWWRQLNRELDERWPGTWHRRPADEDRAGGRNTLTRFADTDACTP